MQATVVAAYVLLSAVLAMQSLFVVHYTYARLLCGRSRGGGAAAAAPKNPTPTTNLGPKDLRGYDLVLVAQRGDVLEFEASPAARKLRADVQRGAVQRALIGGSSMRVALPAPDNTPDKTPTTAPAPATTAPATTAPAPATTAPATTAPAQAPTPEPSVRLWFGSDDAVTLPVHAQASPSLRQLAAGHVLVWGS
jgi:hypothetical protein